LCSQLLLWARHACEFTTSVGRSLIGDANLRVAGNNTAGFNCGRGRVQQTSARDDGGDGKRARRDTARNRYAVLSVRPLHINCCSLVLLSRVSNVGLFKQLSNSCASPYKLSCILSVAALTCVLAHVVGGSYLAGSCVPCAT
jgi:hypothetical protein